METEQKKAVWVRCLVCGGKTRTRVYKKTVLINFPVYCPRCKKETMVDVVQLKKVLSK